MPRLRSVVAAVGATAVCGLAGPAAAPAADPRVAAPVVIPARGETRGTIVLVHGGGWQATGADQVRSMLPTARRFASWGYRTVSIDYAPGQEGLKDVLAAVDDAHARSKGLPVCVYGGHRAGIGR